MLIAGLFPIGLLGELVSIGTLLAFAIVCAGVFVLRFTDPEIHRPFRTPAFWLVCPLGVFFCVWLMYGLPPRHLGAADRLDGHRPGHLLRLRIPPFETARPDGQNHAGLKFGLSPPPAAPPREERNLCVKSVCMFRRGPESARGLAHSMTLREIQSSPKLAERLDFRLRNASARRGGDFSTAFGRMGNIHHSGLSARPTAPLKPAHSKRFARFASRRHTPRVPDGGGPSPLFPDAYQNPPL